MMLNPSGARSTVIVPDFVSNATCLSSRSTNSNTVQADASVACPHRSTSPTGVNHRSPKRPLPSRTKNAVSARLFSLAIFCIKEVSSQDSSGTIAAGLPSSGRDANASTCQSLSFIARRSCTRAERYGRWLKGGMPSLAWPTNGPLIALGRFDDYGATIGLGTLHLGLKFFEGTNLNLAHTLATDAILLRKLLQSCRVILQAPRLDDI